MLVFRPADTNLHPFVFFADRCRDRTETIMAALASPDLDLNIARPTLDVVVEYNDAVQLKFVEIS